MSQALCVIAMITHLLLALLVVHRAPRRATNLVFGAMLCLFLLWDLAELLLLRLGPEPLLIRLLFTAPALLAYLLALFASLFPRRIDDSPVVAAGWRGPACALPALGLLGLVWTDRLPATAELGPGSLAMLLGPYGWVAKGVMVIYLIITLYALSRARADLQVGLPAQRLKYTFMALVLPGAAGSVLLVLARLYLGTPEQTVYPFGVFPGLGIAMAGILGYAILRYNLLGVDALISIGLVYTLLTVLLGGVMELLENAVQSVLELSDLLATMMSTLVIAATFSPLRDWIQKIVDRCFGRQPIDVPGTLRVILGEMRRSHSQIGAMERMLDLVRELTGNTAATVILRDGATVVRAETVMPPPLPAGLPAHWPAIDDLEALVELLEQEGRMDDAGYFSAAVASGYRFGLAIPSPEEPVGMWLLAGKPSRIGFSDDEWSLFRALAAEVPPVLEGLRLVGQMLERQRDLQELGWTRHLYQRMQPPPDLERVAGLPARCFSALSPTIKGDLLDLWPTPDGGAWIGLNDAFGQGIQAALTLQLVRACLRSLGPDVDPATAIASMDRVLRDVRDPGVGVALTLVRLAPAAAAGSTGWVVNTGNPAPLLVKGGVVGEIGADLGVPLGNVEERVGSKGVTEETPVAPDVTGSRPVHRLELAPGDLLLITTNGLLSALDPNGREVLHGAVATAAIGGVGEVHAQIQGLLARQLGPGGHHDDITYLVLGCPAGRPAAE